MSVNIVFLLCFSAIALCYIASNQVETSPVTHHAMSADGLMEKLHKRETGSDDDKVEDESDEDNDDHPHPHHDGPVTTHRSKRSCSTTAAPAGKRKRDTAAVTTTESNEDTNKSSSEESEEDEKSTDGHQMTTKQDEQKKTLLKRETIQSLKAILGRAKRCQRPAQPPATTTTARAGK